MRSLLCKSPDHKFDVAPAFRNPWTLPRRENSPPDGYGNPKTLVFLRFFEPMEKSGTNAVRAIPLVHKQNLKNHYCSTIISKEKCTTMTPVFYDVNDVQDVLRCKESKAYRVIRECNKESQALRFMLCRCSSFSWS